MENVRETILDDAMHAVCGDRDHQYGSPEDNFDQIARFWSVYLHSDLTSCDVANMMILFKLARNMTGEPKLDNWVDIAGYAACGADMRGEQDDENRSNSNAQTDTRARGMGATDKSSGI